MALDFPSNPTNGQVYDNFIYDSAKGTWKSLSSGASPSILVNPTITNAVITATAPNATTVPLTVKGAASQSANLQEWKNSSGTNLTSLNSSGDITTSGRFLSSAVSGASRFYAENTNSASDQFLYLLNGVNDTGSKAVHFVNSSTRTTDGGANGYTIRNDGGPLNLGNSSYKTNISGIVSMPQQPVYSGTIQYTPAVNAYPVTYDTFITGFSKSGNNRLTTQVAGKYYVAAQQLINGGSYLCIYKNGSEVAHAYSNADDTYDMNVSALIDLQVNDYVELYYHGGSLSYAWGDAHSRYSVFKVS